MNYPSVTLPTLEALYQLGSQVCTEIEKFQPDVVIGLAHSGWMPVVVAQTIWEATRTKSFPPATRTNIGLEKNKIYATRYGKSTPAFCCAECSDDPGRKSHYLAWVSNQTAWLKTLKKQITEVFPTSPKRVLIVDDTFGGYRSGYAALALIEALYPQVETRVYAGYHDLTDAFVNGWLQEFAPTLAMEIPPLPENDYSRVQRYRSPWQKKLKPLITGTEDIRTQSLDWRFIQPDSRAVLSLSGHVPAEVALAGPAWAKTLACTYALQRLTKQIPDADAPDPGKDDSHLFPIRRLTISPAERLATLAWKQGGVRLNDLAQVYGDSPEQIQKALKEVHQKSEWVAHDQNQNAVYFPFEALGSWVNAFNPLDSGKVEFQVRGFAEFLPGKIWAGVYPIPSDDRAQADFNKALLSTGVTIIINLTNSKDFFRKQSYRKALQQASAETGQPLDINILPLPFQASPTRPQVQKILRTITRSLKSGQRIYIHAGYNLEGRTPLVLACLLKEYGASPQSALAQVNAFWFKTLHFLIRSPLSLAQEKFILSW